MATSLDPTFGAGFNADEFRSKIRATMNMGLPENEDERVTFRWNPERDYAIEAPSGNPYDFSATPTSVNAPEDLRVPAAVEFMPTLQGSSGTAMGEFDSPRAIITVLDEEYALVKTAHEVLLGDNTYRIRYWGPPMGLFSVSVYQCYVTADDES